MTTAVVRCGECGVGLDERTDLPFEDRVPCSECGSVARRFELSLSGVVKVTGSLALEISREFLERHPFWVGTYIVLIVAAALVGGLLVSGWASVLASLLFAAPLFVVGLRAVTKVREREKRGS